MTLCQFFALIICCFCTTLGHAAHPIYLLLTHPRATGTAFEKVMSTHDEITVLHAPFLYPYLVEKYGPNSPFTQSIPDLSVTFDDVKNQLFELAEKSPVFLKDSGYVLKKYLQANPDFYKNPQVKIAFLVRDPAKSIISFYRKLPTVDTSIIGHKDLWEIYEMLKRDLPETPPVIDSDELLKNPLNILNQLGQIWSLQFDSKNLQWQSKYAEDWHLKNWYIEVGSSTQLESYRGDVPRLDDGTPEYAEVADEVAKERLQGFFRTHNVYYQLLLKEALRS